MDAISPRLDVVRICVPGTPKPLERNRHRIVRPTGKPAFVGNYLPAQSRNEQAVIRDFAKQAMAGRVPLEGPLELRMTAWLAIPNSWSQKKQQAALLGAIYPVGRPDVDNIIKQFADGLKAIVWRDDSQIVDLYVWKRYSQTPQIIAEIRPLLA